MIKANDLRVGNFLEGDELSIPRENTYHNGLTKITGFGISMIEFGKITSLNRVPLTHKWMVDFGFEKDGIQFSKNGVIILFEKRFFKFYYGVGIEDFKNLDYVHQLQNLFYCLTGKELETVANGS